MDGETLACGKSISRRSQLPTRQLADAIELDLGKTGFRCDHCPSDDSARSERDRGSRFGRVVTGVVVVEIEMLQHGRGLNMLYTAPSFAIAWEMVRNQSRASLFPANVRSSALGCAYPLRH